ncbi:uncharacterized protein LOC107268276 isoform X2 [Cephus cinctus]|uniref:Uncharacterized protein LOC107268276 isoform X2 n=1 Tax=Cephus cinctus TaxID=211228 RepID=A0AAJ7W211_CEPCN|nr:uncharacterized protein LOC107268276 isoform X2 [Cephus cinctus]XP_024941496.1 uncharacterized protein LOC107268276 isoform X2 [Cephus cinctus]
MECPEAVERGRNFRLLTAEELPKLLDFLTGYLPESLKPHGLQYESVGVFCPGDRLDLLRLLREEDVLLDWSRPLYINFTHCDIVDELVRLYKDTGTVERVLGDIWACEEPEKTIQVEDDLPANPDVQVGPLSAEHAEGIHELYPANDMECHELFLRLIRTLPAAGVFDKGSLAAWMVQSYYGAMFSMQTKPEYRRKGYGTRLARYLTKRVADKGYNPFVVIRPENEASQSLYRKLGFKKLYQTVRATFTPFSWQEPEEEASCILRDNLENAVRQLKVEQRVIEALKVNEDTTVTADLDSKDDNEGEDAIRGTSDSPEDADVVAENDDGIIAENGLQGYGREEENLEPIEEQPEDRINGLDSPEKEATNERGVESSPEVEDSNEGDGGTETNGGGN